MQDDVAVTVTGQAQRILYVHTAKHKFSTLDQPMNVCADADAIFLVTLVDHNDPFVLGMSVPIIFTAEQSAWPIALKTASAM